MTTSQTRPITLPQDMDRIRALADRFMGQAAELPISFVLDGKPMAGIPRQWDLTSNMRWIDANIRETVFEGRDPATGLCIRVECTHFRDYPVMEWVAWFTNDGQAPTPVISDILAMDAKVLGNSPVLHHCNGDFNSAEGYTPQETPLTPGTKLAFAPNGGRPCDGAFPYHRIVFPEGGLTLATGWPAQWAANFEGTPDGVHIRIGQEKTNLRLMPGETIRTPRITIMAWEGDTTRAINLWRRWYLAHVLPRPNGQPMRPLLACAATDEGEEFTAATEENQVRYIGEFHRRGIRPDVWWIDAGWYPCRNDKQEKKWWITGTWEPDPERFPRGMKAVSDRAARDGASLLVWFEPERVHPGTKLEAQHPQWLLKAKDNNSSLLNLGNPECRQWLTDHVCQLIQANGIRIYRQDHNFAPLQHWRQNDAPDRQGMNENLAVQGYLRFWDDLLLRNPGLWIDSCASGGRRNDLETMRRSVPLHYTDYGYGEAPVKLAFHRTMYQWIPYFKEVTLAWDISGGAGASVQYGKERFDSRVDSYAYHCGLAAMLAPALDIRRDDYDFAGARKLIDMWRKSADLILYGDYYPLTPFHRSDREWVAWQFDNPEKSRGFVQGIRLPSAPQEILTIQLKTIRSDVLYTFENAESGESKRIHGSDLIRDGFTFTLPPRSGALWFYQTQQ